MSTWLIKQRGGGGASNSLVLLTRPMWENVAVHLGIGVYIGDETGKRTSILHEGGGLGTMNQTAVFSRDFLLPLPKLGN